MCRSTVFKFTLISLTVGMAVLGLLALTTSASAAILYAKPGGATSGACNSWGNACGLQYALTTAISGTEIWVAQGVYTPGSSATSTFRLKSGVALYGGFAMTETTRSQRNWKANATVLSGDIDGNDIIDANGVVVSTANISGTNAYHVVIGSGTDATAVLDGFVVTGGCANDPDHGNVDGGGIYNDSGSPTVQNVTFSGNWSYRDGGGMANKNHSNPTLTNVLFIGNQAADGGGGMYNGASSPTLTNVIFNGNSTVSECCYTYGGGMYNLAIGSDSTPTLTNVLFNGNWSKKYGGGLYSYNTGSSGPMLTNVTFSGNGAGSAGGALWLSTSSTSLANSILWGNVAPGGPAIYLDSSTAYVSYSDIQSGSSGSGGGHIQDGGYNINADPQFVAPITGTAAPTTTGNYRLLTSSPAIDAGNNLFVANGTDLDGHPRRSDVPGVPDTGTGTPPIVDMGAYEARVPYRVFLPVVIK